MNPTSDGPRYVTRLIEELDKAGNATWYADHPALAGCHARGASQEEALENLALARDAWLKVSQDLGDTIPVSIPEERTLIQYAPRKDTRVTSGIGAPEETERIPVTVD